MNPSIDIPQELIDLAMQFTETEGIHDTPLRHLKIVRNNKVTQPVQAVYTPALCFIIQGAKEAVVGTKTYRYSPAQYLVTSVDLPVTGRVTSASTKTPYLCLVLEIDPTLVYEILKSSDLSADPSALKGIFLDKVTPDLTDSFLRLLRTLKNKNDTHVLAPLVIREITYRLLHSKYGQTVSQLGIAGSQTQRIAKVIGLLRKDYAKPLRTEELAEIAKMSVSSFHQHFKQVTSLSPLQYQKRIRLQEARRLLSAEVADAATAAFQVGYESPSQFSREYARLFGLPPISDLKRFRQKG